MDFLVEKNGQVLPIEIKSGKNYTRHAALSNVLEVETYGIPEAMVFCNDNVSRNEKVVYYPVYMIMFLEKKKQIQA